MPHSLILVLFLVLLISCKSVPFVPEESKLNYIKFGNGGGFTGMVNTYYLTEKGDLYADGGEGLKKSGSVKKQIADQMIALPKILNIKENPYNVPGNRYFFIEYKIDGEQQKIQWGGDEKHPKEYETWYKNLIFLIKQQNLKVSQTVKL
ncbi:MAG: hypothetical protein IPF52_17185 [Saprospiraceae bacterium]|nr:hypothetical protein [Saprospiraceae bacterium]